MSVQKTASKLTTKESAMQDKMKLPLFEKDNYIWMGVGAAVIGLGMILMSGGKNQDINQFDTSLVYSTTRVTIAPILIMLGFVIEIFAIFKKPKAQ